MIQQAQEKIIEVTDLAISIGDVWIHKNLNLTVYRGEIIGIVGTSGAGKSTLLREILLLQLPTTGSIKLFNEEITTASPKQLNQLRQRCGVLFQHSALFTSLTVLENVAFPLKEHTKLPQKNIHELAMLKIIAVGLSSDTAIKYPAELSGGMEKRAALARASVLDPEILFLDEPTTGLDPHGANALDELVLNLKKTLDLTIVIVTHDLDTLWHVTDRVAFLGEGHVLAFDSMEALSKNPHPLIQDYFSGPRGRTAREFYGT